MNQIEKIVRMISVFFFWVAMTLVGLGMLLISIDVLSRKLLNRPFAFTFELTEIMLLLVGFLGLGYVTSKKRHIAVDILVPKLPDRVQDVIMSFNSVAAIFLFGLISWQTWITAAEMWHRGDMTEILKLSIAPFIFIVSIGSSLMCIEWLIIFVRLLKNAVTGKDSRGLPE